MWLVVANSEDFVPRQNYVEPCDLLDEFPQLIVVSFIHYTSVHLLVNALVLYTPHAFN